MRTQPLIILIDDEDEFLEIASLALQGQGFETFATSDGHSVVAKAEELQPDLVLSDIFMVPGPSGWELALSLRRNPKTSDIKIAFFTSLRDPLMEIPFEAREKVTEELGHPVFLSKIDDVESLAVRVAEIIANKK